MRGIRGANKIVLLMASAMVSFSSYGVLLGTRNYEITKVFATDLGGNVEEGEPVMVATNEAITSGTIRCHNTIIDEKLVFEGALNQVMTVQARISQRVQMICSLAYTVSSLVPDGEHADNATFSLMYNDREIGRFVHGTVGSCSANVDNIDLGVLAPGTTRTVNFPVQTNGGKVKLTSSDMLSGVINLGGGDDVIIQPMDNITPSATGEEWSGISGNSTINVVTSSAALGTYTSAATVVLTCQ